MKTYTEQYPNEYELPEWQHPEYYGGFSPDGDFLVYSQHRDSCLLDRSNYARIFEDLKKKQEEYPAPEDDGYHNQSGSWVYDFRAGHWAVGWVEYILVRRDAPEGLQRFVHEIIGALESYSVYDEDDYCQKQYDLVLERWEDMGLEGRIEFCKANDTSIFAARKGSPYDYPILAETLEAYVDG